MYLNAIFLENQKHAFDFASYHEENVGIMALFFHLTKPSWTIRVNI